MYAVIKTAGKQYRVEADDIIVVDKAIGAPGDTVELGDVMMIGEDGKAPTVGSPLIEKAKVFAEVVAQGKGDKVMVFKKQRRQNYRRLKGHRQMETTLKIAAISPTGTKPKKAAAKKAAPKKEAAAEAPAEAPAETTADAKE